MKKNKNENKGGVKETEIKNLGEALNEEELDQAAGGRMMIFKGDACGNNAGCTQLIVVTSNAKDLSVRIP